jgi:death-on-curing protein
MPGMRDRGLLESALQHPLHVIEYGEEEQHEIHYLAAIYFFHIIKNHAFYDGNKRTGLLTTLTFLSRNSYNLDVHEDVLYNIAIETAKSSMSVEELAAFFRNTAKRN